CARDVRSQIDFW
nr:immunoglobulin heavy chain junction region [Macaca mulatta]MOW78162.1 immunoglobulin heavy chain junction region [Macaca mulatta]MOW79346.1 immunoglobulin heavy chain junction region [Macaca mulatta]MOW85091.1 immunoglobulin heavy chain junction region [Macaca mulatta]